MQKINSFSYFSFKGYAGSKFKVMTTFSDGHLFAKNEKYCYWNVFNSGF